MSSWYRPGGRWVINMLPFVVLMNFAVILFEDRIVNYRYHITTPD